MRKLIAFEMKKVVLLLIIAVAALLSPPPVGQLNMHNYHGDCSGSSW